MSLLSGVTIDKIDLKGIGEGVGSVVGSVGGLFKDIRTALTGKAPIDPNKATELEIKMAEIESNLATLQTNVNAVEAQHASVFVAGWRPYIGWVLGTALGVYFLPIFIIGAFLWARQVITSGVWVNPPDLGIGQVIALLGGMLGFGVQRMLEKKWGVQGNH